MDYNTFKIEVEKLLEERKGFHVNDLRINEYWERISDFMATDEDNTIRFLNECEKDTANWMSEVFEDISERLKSENIIIAFDKLDKKFPDLNLTSFVDGARSFL